MKKRLVRVWRVLVLPVFSIIKGNIVNFWLIPFLLSNWGIGPACWTLVIVTVVPALIMLRWYDKLNKTSFHSSGVIENILSGNPKTYMQVLMCFLVTLLRKDATTSENVRVQSLINLLNGSRFVGRFVSLVVMVTIFDPFVCTAFFRDLKIFGWSPKIIFFVSLVMGIMSTLHAILVVWARL